MGAPMGSGCKVEPIAVMIDYALFPKNGGYDRSGQVCQLSGGTPARITSKSPKSVCCASNHKIYAKEQSTIDVRA